MLPVKTVEPSLSGFIKVSSTEVKLNIPTPALLGVVLKVPTKELAAPGTIGLSLTLTSAINFILKLLATIVLADIENTNSCPTGACGYNGSCCIVNAILFFI